MKFEWIENEPWTQELLESWSLWLMDKARPVKMMGILYQLPTGYVIREPISRTYRTAEEQAVYRLDADLSLEEAQRAAKLFLCVGVAA